MSQNTITTYSPESDVTSMTNFDTELTLGLPGESRSPGAGQGIKKCTKRGFMETAVDSNSHGNDSDSDSSSSKPDAKAQEEAQQQEVIIGWPPVRSPRNKAFEEERRRTSNKKLVKVAVDGAPYLRKVDLQIYGSYEALFKALRGMFTCFTIQGDYYDNNMEERKLIMGAFNGMEYVPTYEDRDDDWMLVGDVPWKMFIESCKRIRLMKNSEAVRLELQELQQIGRQAQV